MLGEAPVGMNIPVKNAQESKRFYEDVLAATPISVNETDIVYQTGNTFFAIYETQQVGKAGHTLGTFVVDDLDATIEGLRDRGVAFEDYDMPGLKTVDSIAQLGENRIAWFKDPDGNILSVAEVSWQPPTVLLGAKASATSR